jgi:penicillin-binding protein 1B
MLSDEQTTYGEGTEYEYTPRNFEGEYHGQVTARYALHALAEQRHHRPGLHGGLRSRGRAGPRAGIKSARGTPSMAIGAYDATPLDMAGAYTVFANGGLRLDPGCWPACAPHRRRHHRLLARLQAGSGPARGLSHHQPDGERDRSRHRRRRARHGLLAPAAGKTGTSHDAWFAGFTSNLLCIVWVGNDDYTDVKIEGRARRRAHLGRVHEEGRATAAVLRHPP